MKVKILGRIDQISSEKNFALSLNLKKNFFRLCYDKTFSRFKRFTAVLKREKGQTFCKTTGITLFASETNNHKITLLLTRRLLRKHKVYVCYATCSIKMFVVKATHFSQCIIQV